MVKWKSDKILGSKWNAGAVTADNRQEMGIGERIHVDFHTATSPARELENLFVLPAGPFHLPLVPPLPCATTSKLSHQVSHTSSCFLVICFGHVASWRDLLTATENKPLLHFSCVTSLTNKLLSKFYTDSCKRPGPFHTECFLQAGIFKKMKYNCQAAVGSSELAKGIFSR